MSYILNALKHSETQRNRGEIPHIDSQPEFVKAPPGRLGERAWKLAALVAVAALLLSLAWVRFGGDRSAISEPLPARPPLAELAAPVPAPQPSAPSPAVPPVTEPLERAPGLPALQDMAGVRIRLEEDAMPGAGAAAAALPAAPESPPVVLEMPVSGGVTPREAAPLLPSPGASAASAAPPAEVLNGVNHWKTLPADIQKQLREMAFTAHIYSANPAARFIRVSGRTLHEGEQLGAELQLQQITRDGIVFTYHGDKFWMGSN